MRFRTCLPGVIFTAIASILVWPASSAGSSLRLIGQAGGPVSTVAVHGSVAFVGAGRRVLVYDVSDPSSPRRLGASEPLPDEVNSLVSDGTYVYVAAGSAGLRILETTELSHPREAGAWDSPGSAEGLALVGNVVYLADGPFGLRSVDVSDPLRPAPLGSAFEESFAFDVSLSGDLALVAGAGAGLLIAGIRDPAHIEEIAALPIEGFVRDVAVSDSTAFLAAQWGGVRAVSIANPRAPAEVGSLTLPSWAFGVALSGTRLFVAAGSRGLYAVDVSSPAALRVAGAYPVEWQHSGSLTLSGNIAYLAARGEGIHAVDVRDPAKPGGLSVSTLLVEARGAAISKGIAYVAAADQGIRILDLDAGAAEIGALPAGGFSNCAATIGENTLVAGSTGIGTPGLYFYDIADARNPVARSVVAGEGINPTDISVQGSLVAICGESGINLIDASNPESPRVLSFLNLTESSPFAALVWDVALSGNTACVAQSGAGLRLVDVTDPSKPRIVGTYNPKTLVHAQAVAASGHLAFVAGGPSGLHIVDISDPRAPETVAVLRPLIGAERMRVSGKSLFIASGANGLISVDVSDPSRPFVTNSTRLPGYAFGVTARDGRVLVASGEAGLHMLEEEPGETVATVGFPAPLLNEAAPPALVALQRQRRGSLPHVPPCPGTEARSPAASGSRLVVTSPLDSGPGTLRDALSRLAPGDTITFDPGTFPPSRPATIAVKEQLPCICADGILLDASNAGVVIDGSGAPPGTMGLILASNENRIQGLSIVNFDHAGLWLSGSRNLIGGNRQKGAGPSGEGNVISGNKYAGVLFPNKESTANRVSGNLIGTDATGSRSLGKQMTGVFLFPGGPGNTIGGTESWEANVISGNALAEVFFQQAHGNTVAGNLIGTDSVGTGRVGNAAMGLGTGAHSSDNVISKNIIVGDGQAIIISDSGSYYNQIVENRIGVGKTGEALLPSVSPVTTGVAVSQSYNRITGNVISGNSQWGVDFSFWASHDSILTGNLIGTDPSGTKSRPNGTPDWGGGISSYTLSHAFIGGTGPAERNVISGNAGSAVVLSGPGTGRNFILGNFIGTDITGEVPLGNSKHGIEVSASDRNVVQRNLIAWNRGSGVFEKDSEGNTIRRNSLHDNGSGIAFAPDSSAVPDVPVITQASRTRITGSACASCRVELFSDAGGEGRRLEGETTAGENGLFQFSKPLGTLSGPSLTATATDSRGTTSSFSSAAALTAPSAEARILLGNSEGRAGGLAIMPISFEGGIPEVAAVVFDVTLPEGLSVATVTPGAAVTAAGKAITTETTTSGVRVTVGASPAQRISDGILASLGLAIAPAYQPGRRQIAGVSVAAVDTKASQVSVSVAEGEITILAPEAPARRWVLPSSARAPGAGTFWTTDLTVRNTSLSPAALRLEFLGHAGGAPLERTVGLAALETRTFRDVLGSIFGIVNDFGPILFRSSSSSIGVGAQTWTPVAGGPGTSGQNVPAVREEHLIGKAVRSIIGVRQDDSFRTNLMVANPGGTPATVQVALVGSDGAPLGQRTLEMPPSSFTQLNVATGFGVEGVSDASLVLSTSKQGEAIAAYASAIDRVTGDPRTLLPGAATDSRLWVLPSSAHASGAGTFWTTDLLIRNESSNEVTAEITFLGHGGSSGPASPRTLDLKPGQTAVHHDVLKTLFGRESDWGPLVVRASSSSLVVAGQTSTPGGGGTYGQSVPGIPSSDFIRSSPRSIPGVREDSAFRTNLMMANSSDSAVEVTVELQASSGISLARRNVSMDARSFVQLSVARDLGVSGIAGATLVLSAVTPGGAVAAYASVIDQLTGDPRTLLPW